MAAKNIFTFKPVRPKRNSEEIASQIEEAIVAKHYKPNDKLPSERQLALQFNAGRGAVREALRKLEESGFIYVKSGGDGGIFVKKLDSSRMTKTLMDLVRIGDIDIEEITEARVTIETRIIELCIPLMNDSDLRILEQNILTCEKLVNGKKPLVGEVQNFHLLLGAFCKNHLLNFFLNALVDISDSFVENKLPGLPLSPAHIDHHKAILQALKKRDLDAARNALCIHLNSVKKHIYDHYNAE